MSHVMSKSWEDRTKIHIGVRVDEMFRERLIFSFNKNSLRSKGYLEEHTLTCMIFDIYHTFTDNQSIEKSLKKDKDVAIKFECKSMP